MCEFISSDVAFWLGVAWVTGLQKEMCKAIHWAAEKTTYVSFIFVSFLNFLL